MNIGSLNILITIQTHGATDTRSTTGDVIPVWTDLSKVWAKKRAIRGGENIAQGQITAVTSVAFTIRYKATVTEKMRISYNGDYYFINAINVLGKDEFMEIITDKYDKEVIQ